MMSFLLKNIQNIVTFKEYNKGKTMEAKTNLASTELLNAKISENSQTNKKKRISFFSAILLVITSCIGSGIFFKSAKVYEDNWGSFILSILSWIIAAFAVICMAISLIEVASNKKGNDNLSLIGWCKRFNNEFIFKCCKNFMFYVFVPLEFFYMPFYITQSLQNAFLDENGRSALTFHTNADWAIWMVIGMGITTWLIFTSGLSHKMADIQAKIVMLLKFFPLALVVVIGIVIASKEGVHLNAWPVEDKVTAFKNPTSFYQLWPGLGTVLSLSAIFFAFDGFYFAAGIQKEMKEPKKTPKAIFVGLIIVTVIYLVIAIVMSIGSKYGKLGNYSEFLNDHNLGWIFMVLNLLIAVSVFGALNGFTVWSTRFIEDLLLDNQLPFASKFNNQIQAHKPIVGTLYVYTMVIPLNVVFSCIGGLAFLPNSNLLGNGKSPFDYGDSTSVSGLYSFADLMSSWVSIIAFMFIVLAIGGALKNRKTNKVEVERNKYFVPTAWISIILVSFVLLITVIQPFADLFLLSNYGDAYTPADAISAWMLVVVLFLIIALMILPIYVEKNFNFLKEKKMNKNI